MNRKTLKIFSIVAAILLVLSVASTSLAAAPESGVAITRGELEESYRTGEPITVGLGDSVSITIEPNYSIPTTRATAGTWYNCTVNFSVNGQSVGKATQPVFIGYVNGYYFGSMNPMSAESYNGWTPYSITSSGGWGSQNVQIYASWSHPTNGYGIQGTSVNFYIDPANGTVYAWKI